MGCGSCGSGGCSSEGCGRNGGCATGGCNKLNTYDWLGNMLGPDQTEINNIYEVRFKNTRKEFYRNVNGLRLFLGDYVVVESDRGFDVGQLSLGGVMAELQMKKKRVKARKDKEDVPKIYRKANEADIELLNEVRERENATRVRTKGIIQELGLDMKLSDVEFQGDATKATFYYIADHRVDFRELIKVLAREFRIRVEMKQIGLRHEAGLVGGIGSCGRELCCSTWLTDFKTVSTSAARYQNLSLNPMKISGLCGRLKCCLNFELDSYLDALRNFPKIEKLETVKGIAFLQKTDIFKGKMWFSYPNETTWYALDVADVKELMEKKEKGEKIESLVVKSNILNEGGEDDFDFVDVVGQVQLNHFDEKNKRPKRKNKRKPRNKKGGNQGKNQAPQKDPVRSRRKPNRRKNNKQGENQPKDSNNQQNQPKLQEGEKQNQPNKQKRSNRNSNRNQRNRNSKRNRVKETVGGDQQGPKNKNAASKKQNKSGRNSNRNNNRNRNSRNQTPKDQPPKNQADNKKDDKS